MIQPALALIEFSSIASGIQAADAMVKRAPILVIKSGTVQPGKYLVLIGGEVADVEESVQAGKNSGGPAIVDLVYLPHVHQQVVEALSGSRVPELEDALGVIETRTVAAAIHAADAGIKGAAVRLLEVRLADGLGGKGIVLFSGLVHDVQAAIEIGVGVLESPDLLVQQVVIPQLHPELWDNLSDSTYFSRRVSGKL
ncbi:MAG: BMC domain-containing protein [Anaerolineales bacterium]|nr:MAG: BMC domain-containing protein [Anaerolineales bacterium]